MLLLHLRVEGLQSKRPAFASAHASVPGDDTTLRILEHTAILSGDIHERRRWLDARLALNPDSPELLRAHAHLLATMGDEDAHKDIMRLEALGLDTQQTAHSIRTASAGAFRSLEQSRRPREDPSRSDDWCARGEILYALEKRARPLKALTGV